MKAIHLREACRESWAAEDRQGPDLRSPSEAPEVVRPYRLSRETRVALAWNHPDCGDLGFEIRAGSAGTRSMAHPAKKPAHGQSRCATQPCPPQEPPRKELP